MENKRTGVLSGVGFYVTLVICLVAAGIGGYFLVFGGQEAAQEEDAPQTAVTAKAPEIPEEQEPVEAVSPAELADEPSAEPEPEPEPALDDTPVVAAIPQVVMALWRGKWWAPFTWMRCRTTSRWETGGPMTALTSPRQRELLCWRPPAARCSPSAMIS